MVLLVLVSPSQFVINIVINFVIRHTFASRLFAAGEDVKTVSELLGHSDITITYNTYIHLINEQKRKAVQGIQTKS